MSDITMSRRSILASAALGATAAAAAIPVAIRAKPALEATSCRSAWDRAWKKYVDANRQYRHFEATVWKPAYSRVMRGLGRNVPPGDLPLDQRKLWDERYARDLTATGLSARSEVLCNAYCDAKDVLMGIPAPDMKSLLFKLEVLLEWDDSGDLDDKTTPPWSCNYVAQTVSDMRRLLGEA